jgi:hypothetical protein
MKWYETQLWKKNELIFVVVDIHSLVDVRFWYLCDDGQTGERKIQILNANFEFKFEVLVAR